MTCKFVTALEDRVIMKFKCRKRKHHVALNHKTLQNKNLNLMQLKFSGKLFVNESMCHENHQLANKCCQLKSACKIHSIHKIFHATDIEKVLGVDNLIYIYEYINNVSF